MKAQFKLLKRCTRVDKYIEVDASSNEVDKDLGNPLLGTVYVAKSIAQGSPALTITVEVSK